MSKNILKAALFTVISGVSGLSLAEETRPFPFPGEVTGNIGVFSSYNLRGLTNVPEKVGWIIAIHLGFMRGIGVPVWTILWLITNH